MTRSHVAATAAVLLLAVVFATGILAATVGPRGHSDDGAGDPGVSAGSAQVALAGAGRGGERRSGEAGVTAEPPFREEWFTIGPDTIRYRVCKDLTICYLEFTYPSAGVTPGPPPIPGPPSLTLVELPPVSTPVVTDRRWAWLALPLVGAFGTLGRRSSGQPPGAGPPPPEPPGPQPPGPPEPPTVIPEPASLLLLGTGLAGIALRARRKRPTEWS